MAHFLILKEKMESALGKEEAEADRRCYRSGEG